MKTALTKKILILISTVLILLLISVVPMLAEEGTDVFTDVTEGSWYYDHVMYAYENGLMTGVADGFFAPGNGFSRAMIVQVLYNMSGAPETAVTEAPFEDVPVGKWYTVPVAWAKENNIVAGRGNGFFDPAADITRAELCTVLNSYAKFAYLKLPEIREIKDFADKNDIPGFALDAVNALYTAGVIDGKPEDRFDPRSTASRAEAATMIHAFAENAIEMTMFEKYGLELNVEAYVGTTQPAYLNSGFSLTINKTDESNSITRKKTTVSGKLTNGENVIEIVFSRDEGSTVYYIPTLELAALNLEAGATVNAEITVSATFGDNAESESQTFLLDIVPEVRTTLLDEYGLEPSVYLSINRMPYIGPINKSDRVNFSVSLKNAGGSELAFPDIPEVKVYVTLYADGDVFFDSLALSINGNVHNYIFGKIFNDPFDPFSEAEGDAWIFDHITDEDMEVKLIVEFTIGDRSETFLFYPDTALYW